MKKVLLIVAFENFRDEELNIPLEQFSQAGWISTVASTQEGRATGMFGTKINVDLTLQQVIANQYQAIVFVGGQGTPVIRSSQETKRIISEVEQKQILAAICWAPTILALTGKLKGKKATVWKGEDTEFQTTTDKLLIKHGATFEEKPVVVDGLIVTANGPNAAFDFAKAIIQLEKKQIN